ncbi:phosphoribosyltransferase family protein [Tenacibaculum pacificus]|uniref:ComF family protein n=1 Tax=Tenacibaculum pacificus TaxID=3018314 RepID=UPI0022F39D4F|nr:phosphoribosyltransferase family protein [Tenacibaculum pacificus]WBX73595.1 phosphoribosyltransferase family protein [Tenacibaculum pacificus]
MHYLKDIFYLFYPNLCIHCSIVLLQNEEYLCITCSNNLPIITSNEYINNELLSVFYGQVLIENVRSFLYYKKGNITQKIIYELKYKNQPEIGIFLANWFGEKLKESAIFKTVDYIISVPLHQSKLKKRGYNQLTKFGERLSVILNIEYKPDVLIKLKSANTQTKKQRFERFLDIKNSFKLIDLELFESKRVLLIDDVITTGATLVSCCEELSKTKNITISIATMSYAKKE